MLGTECDKYGVSIQLRSEVSDVEAVENNPKVRFKLKVNAVDWQCQNLIIATGGLSMPGLGASPFGYQIAEQFGLNVIPHVRVLYRSHGEKVKNSMQHSLVFH